jgi:ParB family chromosome partitioning protein
MADEKKAWNAESAGKVLYFDPENLKIVKDEKSALYDERINLALDENHIANVMAVGILEPILVRKAGEDKEGLPIVEVVDGRQRVRWAIEANKRLKKDGKELIRVPGVPRRGDDAELFGVMISTNEVRRMDDAITRAKKVKRYMEMGRTEEEAATAFGKSAATIKNLLTLLEGTPAVQRAVSEGKISIQVGKRLAVLPKEEQSAALEDQLKTGGGAAGLERAEKRRGKRGKVRGRKVKTRQQMKEMRDLLAKKKTSEPALVGAAVLAWALGDDEAIKPYRALLNAAEEV